MSTKRETTNTNITLKKRSNHRENTKKGVIKGYSDRARALCDPEYLQDELQHIEEVFVENGYSRREVRKAMEERQTTGNEEEEKEEQKSRGIVSIPHIPSFTRTFSRIAKQQKFRAATRATYKALTPLGQKNEHVAYNIPCVCLCHSYSGEMNRMWRTRKNEHIAKVRLTKTG